MPVHPATSQPVRSPNPSPKGIPAPYGRACTNCARAKCRCIYEVEGAGCDRCRRLKKECIPSVSIRKRGTKRQSSSRTAQLEEKLEDLVRMLRDQNAAKQLPSKGYPHQDSDAGIPSPSNTSPRDPSASGGSDKPSPSDVPGYGATSQARPAALSSDASPPALCNPQPDSPPAALVNPSGNTVGSRAEAEAGLRYFRSHYLETFPCVYLPPDMTAEQLRQEKPFLWFNILAMTCRPATRQIEMGETIKKIVAQKLVVEHEYSIDMLLGLLVFIAWARFRIKDKLFLSTFSQLAIATVFELGLNRPPGEHSALHPLKANSYVKPQPTKEKTMEERRAVLACFQLTSQLAFTMKKMDGLAWTPFLDECLNELIHHPECPGDEILATQVRIQLVIEQLGRAPWLYSEPRGVTSGPPSAYLHALHSQLDRIKSEIPPVALKGRGLIRLQVHYAKLALFESGLCRSTPVPSHNPDFRRNEVLSKCLEETKTWFDIFFSIQSTDYQTISFSFWCQLGHCVISLYKLTFFDDPAWDRRIVWAELDLLQTCDKVTERCYAVCNELGLNEQRAAEHLIGKTADMIRTIRAVWASELAKLERQPPPGTAAGGQGEFIDGVTTGPMAVPLGTSDDLWMTDNTWLTDIFNVSWE